MYGCTQGQPQEIYRRLDKHARLRSCWSRLLSLDFVRRWLADPNLLAASGRVQLFQDKVAFSPNGQEAVSSEGHEGR
jgi:hypothetical protein